MSKMKKNINVILLNQLSKTRKNNIYYIDITDGGMSGFFALLRGVLDWVCYADEMHFVPYVIYSGKTLYSEEKPVKGTRNVFEYYFQQTNERKGLLLPWNINLVRANSIHFDEIEYKYNRREFSYFVSDDYINHMAVIYNKYFKLTNDTEKYIRQSAGRILKGKKTLGIHIRGTDFNKKFDNHPVPIAVDEYVSYINDVFEKYHFEQIFVATDDERCLNELKKQLFVPVVYYEDTKRSDTDKSVAFTMNKRKHHKYLLGLEVLRDVYTLAYCSGFIGCLSQMDIFVQIIKKSRGKDFIYKQILEHGTFSTGKLCWEPVK